MGRDSRCPAILVLAVGLVSCAATPSVAQDASVSAAVEKLVTEDVPHVKSPFGFYGAIVPRPDGRLLAFSSDFHVMTSEDGGETWSKRRKLAISDPFDKITGAIAMSDGSIGIHTESWSKPLYFWKSGDEGSTWTTRVEIAPEGAPLHGSVMIELAIEKERIAPIGWTTGICAKDGRQDLPESKSAFRQVAGGRSGKYAGILTLDAADKWVYGATRIRPERLLEAGDEYVCRVTARTDGKATFDLYADAWDAKTDDGSKQRQRFKAGEDWRTYEVKLTISEAAHGLDSFRILVQLYTPAAKLLFDDVKVLRVTPAKGGGDLPVPNASFEEIPVGRLVIPVRQGYAFPGTGTPAEYMAGGTDITGKRITIEGHGQLAEMVITRVHVSDDGGASWKRVSPAIFIWKDNGLGGSWMADEPNVVQLRDGNLLMFLRNPLGRIYQTTSADRGQTWAYPEPAVLPSSLSPCSLERVPENGYTKKTQRAGDLICVWNNVSHEEIKRGFRRGRLCSAVSMDDGSTWTNVRTIDTAGLAPISEPAETSAPQMMRADRDLGKLPVPIGFVDYPDITITGDRVLIKYSKKMKNPDFDMGTRIRILPLDWFYED